MANVLGRTGNASPFPTSETVGTSVADPKLGSQWIDGSDNVYVVVDCQSSFVAGEFVFIDSAHLASRIGQQFATSGRVGVIVAAVSASDTKAYAQIYGLYEGAAGSSNVTSAGYLALTTTSEIGAAGAANSSSDTAAIAIHGAYVVTAPASDTTSPASSFVSAAGTSTAYIGFSVWLNYPYVHGFATFAYGGTS